MTDDPRLMILRERYSYIDHKLRLLAELDAVDPLRQPVSQDRVDAALDAYRTGWQEDTSRLEHKWRSDMARALAAAVAEKPDFPLWSREMARLLEFVAVVMPRRDWTSAELNEYRAAVFAAFPETTDVG